jgi:hypothetical protein
MGTDATLIHVLKSANSSVCTRSHEVLVRADCRRAVKQRTVNAVRGLDARSLDVLALPWNECEEDNNAHQSGQPLSRLNSPFSLVYHSCERQTSGVIPV